MLRSPHESKGNMTEAVAQIDEKSPYNVVAEYLMSLALTSGSKLDTNAAFDFEINLHLPSRIAMSEQELEEYESLLEVELVSDAGNVVSETGVYLLKELGNNLLLVSATIRQLLALLALPEVKSVSGPRPGYLD